MSAFRLAALHRLRQMQEDQAAAQLALANSALADATTHAATTQRALAATALPARGDAATWGVAIAGRNAMGVLVNESTVAVADASLHSQTLTRDWSAARTRTATLDKLRARHDAAAHAEDLRTEQLALDEVATRARTTQETSR